LTKNKFSEEEAGRSSPPNNIKTAQGQGASCKNQEGMQS
jgi:hypothetical protein